MGRWARCPGCATWPWLVESPSPRWPDRPLRRRFEAHPSPEGTFGVVMASLDGIAGYRVDRPRLLEGRMPIPERVGEALATQTLARRLDLEVGDRLDLVVVPGDLDGRATASDADGEVVRVEVTGIGVMASEVVPFTDLEGEGRLVTTAPFASLSPRVDWGFEGAYIDVEPGADRDEVARALVDVANEALGPEGQLFVSDQVAGARGVQDALRPLAAALAVFAAATAAVATVVVAQSVLRSSRLKATEKEAMRALGASPRQQVLLLVGRAGTVGVLGALGAVFLAVALSPVVPGRAGSGRRDQPRRCDRRPRSRSGFCPHCRPCRRVRVAGRRSRGSTDPADDGDPERGSSTPRHARVCRLPPSRVCGSRCAPVATLWFRCAAPW